ncbi:MAG TPA: CbiX/SirB N-terminal domain-containing protein [Accumulibacter sp.]|jgi:sirohydrochlorin cobaltochelatase|nr:CbiX/SirB N-terminal domain-containing protein [Accumulibacter sp.]HQC81245.1 CbiX/SirB N-terminal domain-containing protein [Accumulibacter sp.]
MPKTALILFAHGARDPEWAAPLKHVASIMREHAPALRVELAFFEFMQPRLQASVETLLPEGFQRILILPMFIARGGHLQRDVPLLVEELRARHPRIDFQLAAAVGEAEAVMQAMAAHALRLAGV